MAMLSGAELSVRVLHVVVSLDAGGMERVLTRVAHELEPRGFDMHVCGLERRGALAEAFPTPGQVVTLGKPEGRSLRTIWGLHRMIRRVRPDVLHTHNLGPLLYGVPATFFGLLCPILHGEHCQLLCPELGPPRLGLRRWLYRACRGIHTVSSESRTELIGLGFPSVKIEAVVNGVDTEEFAPGDPVASRRVLGVPEDGRLVAIVARFEERKRHALLIEAVAKTVDSGMDVHLLVAGDGALRPDLEALACALGVEDRVHFLGFREDVATVYHATDLVVLPSTGEGLSNAILEAMACGKPVLCHSACGCSEVIADGDDGWVREISDADVLAGTLAELLATPEQLQSAGRSARQKVIEQFGFRQVADRYEALYRRIAGKQVGTRESIARTVH